MRVNNIALQSCVYNYDSFNTCSSPCRITTSDITISTEASYLLSLLSIIHHSSINFTPKHIIQLYSALSPISHTFHHTISPEDILWLSFDSITTSFGSLHSLWPGGSVTNFVFKRNLWHHHIAYFLFISMLRTCTTISRLSFKII